MGYHINEIERGVFGEWNKIREEYEEWQDARQQSNPVMELVELADLLGAIEAYTKNYYKISLDDLLVMTLATKRAFEDGARAPRDVKKQFPEMSPPISLGFVETGI